MNSGRCVGSTWGYSRRRSVTALICSSDKPPARASLVQEGTILSNPPTTARLSKPRSRSSLMNLSNFSIDEGIKVFYRKIDSLGSFWGHWELYHGNSQSTFLGVFRELLGQKNVFIRRAFSIRF